MNNLLPFFWQLGFYRWQDGIELLIISSCIYYLSLWLAQDFQKPLLAVFYGYCVALPLTDYFQCTTLHTLLLLFLPVACVVFLIVHQETLQKNMISLHTITPQKRPATAWVEALTRSALMAASDNKPFSCVIEKTQALETVVESRYCINATLCAETLQLIRTSSLYNPEQMLWINNNAHLYACNATWKKDSVSEWLLQEGPEELWLRDALFFTKKTDALYLSLSPATRTFTLIAHGKIIEKALAQHVSVAIHTYLGYSSPLLGGDWHVPFKTHNTSEQIHS